MNPDRETEQDTGTQRWAVRVALVLWGGFVAAEGAARAVGLYRLFPAWDVPSHALSGAALGATATWLFLRLARPRPATLSFLATALVAALWEVVEQVDEMFSPDPPYLRDLFFWDGFFDVLVTSVAGGLVAWWLVGRSRKA